MAALDPYWQAATDALAREFEPGAPFLTSSPGADSLGDATEFTPGCVVPFLLSPAFCHPASRPTPHEWLTAKRVERGVVLPFVHISTDTQEAC